jgi:type II secretory pathway predicted ATPase ExeA
LRQFAQRISVDFHLRRLDSKEAHAYVHHRLEVEGGDPRLFSPEAIEFIHARTQGVPRLMNQLCDFALLYAFADGRKSVDADLISQVISERGNVVAMPPPHTDTGATVGTRANGTI